jgi:ribonuclease HI
MIFEYYTDGACTLKKTNKGYEKGPGGWAFALVKDNKIEFSQSLPLMHTTNNEAELYAIYRALVHYTEHFYSKDIYDTIKIYSDSAYCVNMLKEGGWVYSWKNNGWTRGKKHEPIENLDIIQKIYITMLDLNEGFHNIEFIKVPGHSNNEFNNYVDKLAVEAKMSIGIQNTICWD